eukprot:3126644-Alexandrium_andersonii.AAC.1
MHQRDFSLDARAGGMEYFGCCEGMVNEHNAALQPVGPGREAEAINELARPGQRLDQFLEGNGRLARFGALRGRNVRLPLLEVFVAELLRDDVLLN